MTADQLEIERLRKALAFYAEASNYVTTSTGFAAFYDPAMPAVEKDYGHLAREALGGCNEPRCRPCHRPVTH